MCRPTLFCIIVVEESNKLFIKDLNFYFSEKTSRESIFEVVCILDNIVKFLQYFTCKSIHLFKFDGFPPPKSREFESIIM